MHEQPAGQEQWVCGSSNAHPGFVCVTPDADGCMVGHGASRLHSDRVDESPCKAAAAAACTLQLLRAPIAAAGAISACILYTLPCMLGEGMSVVCYI